MSKKDKSNSQHDECDYVSTVLPTFINSVVTSSFIRETIENEYMFRVISDEWNLFQQVLIINNTSLKSFVDLISTIKNLSWSIEIK